MIDIRFNPTNLNIYHSYRIFASKLTRLNLNLFPKSNLIADFPTM